MKKRTKIILISILFIGVFGVFALEFLCKIGIKCNKCTRTSISKTESKENGFYLAEYKPLIRSLTLTQHDETIEFMDIWVENQWYVDSDICLLRRMKLRDGFNVVFEFKKSNENTFLYTLSPIIDGKIDETNGGIMQDKKEIRLSHLTDTLWLKIHEKNPYKDVGWKNEIEGQKIGFVKK